MYSNIHNDYLNRAYLEGLFLINLMSISDSVQGQHH